MTYFVRMSIPLFCVLIYNYKIKISFVIPEKPKARTNKTGFNIMNMILYFFIRKKQDILRHDFLVWLRTGSYLPDINRF